VELVKTRIPRHFGLNPIRDIQVLCPMNRGGVGARSLNIELQAALNPSGETKVERFGWTFAAGDKVMQIENDYDKEVYNGDIGYIFEVVLIVGALERNDPGVAISQQDSVGTVVLVVAAALPELRGNPELLGGENGVASRERGAGVRAIG
jgi:exodeoxyribonuclease V alpha subunit